MWALPPATQRFATSATLTMAFIIACRQVSTRSMSSSFAASGFVQRLQPPPVKSGKRPRQTLHSGARDHAEPVTGPIKEPTAKKEKYQKTYMIQGSTSEKSRAGVTVRTATGRHVLETDLPRTMGGTDAAAQPVETLLAALVGCTQATALFVARNLRPRRLDIDRIDFDLTAARDERGALALPIDSSSPGIPSRLHTVLGTVWVHATNGRPISDRDLALLREQTELRCPVANMMGARWTFGGWTGPPTRQKRPYLDASALIRLRTAIQVPICADIGVSGDLVFDQSVSR